MSLRIPCTSLVPVAGHADPRLGLHCALEYGWADLPHSAATADGIHVSSWVGDVPRIGESIATIASRRRPETTRWRATDVTRAVRYQDKPPVALVTVEPASDAAATWLDRARAERAARGPAVIAASLQREHVLFAPLAQGVFCVLSVYGSPSQVLLGTLGGKLRAKLPGEEPVPGWLEDLGHPGGGLRSGDWEALRIGVVAASDHAGRVEAVRAVRERAAEYGPAGGRRE